MVYDEHRPSGHVFIRTKKREINEK
jgi:hypothetical protein